MACSPKLEYQTMPCASTTTSCGSIVARGRAYSVTTTCVAAPEGRGKVLSWCIQLEVVLKLIELRNSANLRWDCCRASPRGASSHRAGRFCVCRGKLEFV